MRELVPPNKSKMNVALWGSLNRTIISCGDDGCIRLWDVETGEETKCVQAHSKKINDMRYSKDQTMFITASSDHTAKHQETQSPDNDRLAAHLIRQPAQRHLQCRLRQTIGAQCETDARNIGPRQFLSVDGEQGQDHEEAQHAQAIQTGQTQHGAALQSRKGFFG